MYRLIETDSDWFWTHKILYNSLAGYLEEQGLLAAREQAKHFRPSAKFFRRRGRLWEIRPECAVIVEEATGNYVVLDCADHLENHDPRLLPVLRDPRCQVYLKAQYREEYCRRKPYHKIQPWIYFEFLPTWLQRRVDYLRCVRRIHRPLYFRGNTDRSFRDAVIRQLRENQIVGNDTHTIEMHNYINEMTEHRLALSLPGFGNLCHRMFEAFAIGTPVLSPVLRNTLHDPLIPDYHYISVDIDPDAMSEEEIATRLELRYEEVIDDHELLDGVRDRAVEWYERNVRYPASLELTCRLLGLLPR